MTTSRAGTCGAPDSAWSGVAGWIEVVGFDAEGAAAFGAVATLLD
jgi:hypothetical protein